MQWSPRRGETAALAAMGLGLAVAAAFLDAAGRVLVGAGALLVLVLVVRDLVARPRLSAGPDGVDVRSWTRARHLPWRGLRVHVRINRRLGFRSRTLELDTPPGRTTRESSWCWAVGISAPTPTTSPSRCAGSDRRSTSGRRRAVRPSTPRPP